MEQQEHARGPVGWAATSGWRTLRTGGAAPRASPDALLALDLHLLVERVYIQVCPLARGAELDEALQRGERRCMVERSQAATFT
jgi:hypothetical protein